MINNSFYSPINYPGNKSRIAKEILSLFPNDINRIIEPFCGSAVVSLNSAAPNIVLNDSDKTIISLLQYFHNYEPAIIEKNIDEIITVYGFTDSIHNKYVEEQHEGLSRYNRNAFNKLRDDYNKDKDMHKLFALIIFGFNHYPRFNSSGKFNIPVGKSDYNQLLREKTYAFSLLLRKKNIEFYNLDFNQFLSNETFNGTDLVYCDPPYLITSAPYNLFWNEKREIELLAFLDELDNQGIRFALSNVFSSNGASNNILQIWSSKYIVHHIKRQYLNSNYRKKNLSDADEILITNFSRE